MRITLQHLLVSIFLAYPLMRVWVNFERAYRVVQERKRQREAFKPPPDVPWVACDDCQCYGQCAMDRACKRSHRG